MVLLRIPYMYLGYIPITCSRKLVEAGMCTRPSREDNTKTVEDRPVAGDSIRKTQVSFLPGQ
jgi:hypothetical protein